MAVWLDWCDLDSQVSTWLVVKKSYKSGKDRSESNFSPRKTIKLTVAKIPQTIHLQQKTILSGQDTHIKTSQDLWFSLIYRFFKQVNQLFQFQQIFSIFKQKKIFRINCCMQNHPYKKSSFYEVKMCMLFMVWLLWSPAGRQSLYLTVSVPYTINKILIVICWMTQE